MITEGMHYNPYFSGRQIAMAPPLFEGQVKYADGAKATVSQMAQDVVTFLSWAAEPEMEQRKRMGVKVLFYLLILTLVLYLSKRKIWKGVE
jgi:ubiquinol-cytochrome c reductase cytochrome c1 subunit